MVNIEQKREGTKLTLVIDLSKEFGRSKSGKSITVATTSGNVSLDGGFKLGLNLYK